MANEQFSAKSAGALNSVFINIKKKRIYSVRERNDTYIINWNIKNVILYLKKNKKTIIFELILQF